MVLAATTFQFIGSYNSTTFIYYEQLLFSFMNYKVFSFFPINYQPYCLTLMNYCFVPKIPILSSPTFSPMNYSFVSKTPILSSPTVFPHELPFDYYIPPLTTNCTLRLHQTTLSLLKPSFCQSSLLSRIVNPSCAPKVDS
jgi:hypothetical protein